jgi:hypothetical protein
MDLGAIFIILAVALLVGILITLPLMGRGADTQALVEKQAVKSAEINRSALLAERDRILTALAELDADNALGKVPEEGYPIQRQALVLAGVKILRELETVESAPTATQGEEADELEALIQARRLAAVEPAPEAAPAAHVAPRRNNGSQPQVSFCPKCGKELRRGDIFCAKCGAKLG